MRKRSVRGAIKLQKVEFQGPLPPPAVLAQYENIHSGFADRIISMAETQAAHRQSLERDQSESRRRLVEFYGDDLRGRRDQLRRGQYLGAGVCALTTICGACIAILTEATAGQIAGGLVSVSGLGGIVVALMTGRMRREGADENDG